VARHGAPQFDAFCECLVPSTYFFDVQACRSNFLLELFSVSSQMYFAKVTLQRVFPLRSGVASPLSLDL